jgi:hypothetical protein
MAVFVIGHLTSDLKGLGDKTGSMIKKVVLEFLYYFLPNLDNFNIRSEAVHGVAVSWGYIAFAVSYGLLYVAILIAASVIIFQNRDFK